MTPKSGRGEVENKGNSRERQEERENPHPSRSSKTKTSTRDDRIRRKRRRQRLFHKECMCFFLVSKPQKRIHTRIYQSANHIARSKRCVLPHIFNERSVPIKVSFSTKLTQTVVCLSNIYPCTPYDRFHEIISCRFIFVRRELKIRQR